MPNKEEVPRESRKPYAKPEVRQVPLRPEEAVLGGCKTTSTGGPGAGTTCNTPPACPTIGS